MSTVRDLVTAALLDLGAIASGEALTAAEAADAFRRLNLLLASWNLERLSVYAIDEVTKVLTGASSYTYGSAGDINAARPVRLEQAAIRLAGTAPALDLPVHIATPEEYHGLGLKGLSGTYARWLYLDEAYPLATLFVWPVSPSGDTLVLWPWHQLSTFASLDTTVAFPPGYELALQTNLSIHLSPMFRDCQVTPWLAAMAGETKALLKIANSRPHYLGMPAGIPAGHRGRGTDRAGFLSGWNT